MALRDQPYIPLYVMDFLSDEKLRDCSAESVGVYIMLMCVMHKSETYGTIVLKPKYQNAGTETQCYAKMLRKQLPFSEDVIERALDELLDAGVLTRNPETNFLQQKRMVKDFDISTKRAEAGKQGGYNARNTPKKRFYNEAGYIYVASVGDSEDEFKVGVSKTPERRLKGLSKEKGVELTLEYSSSCDDMGTTEQSVLDELSDYREGEWVSGVTLDFIINIIEQQNNSKPNSKTVAKQTANSENENEVEIEGENDTDTGKKDKPKTSLIDERFKEFWKAYPRKSSKGSAEKSFKKIAPNKELFDQIMRALELAKSCDQWKKDNGQFIPYPSTWLNQRRWEDEYTTTSGVKRSAETPEDPDSNPFAEWGDGK